MDGCSIIFHNVPKVDSVIKELENNNPADCYKLAAFVKTEEFAKYCREDEVAKTDNLESIHKNVLKRLIKNYRNNKIFNVNNTSKVNAESGMYMFRSQAAFDTATQFTADLISTLNYRTSIKDKADLNYLVRLIATAKNSFKKQLILKANQYGKFDINNLEAAYYAIEENGTDQERNFKDMVQSALGDPNFWNEVFYNSKIASLGRNTDFQDEAYKYALMEATDEDVIADIAQSDEVDMSTKQWDFGNNINSYAEHISEVVRQYFDSLQRLNSTQRYADGKYDVDRNNPIGVPTCHTYQECTIELSNVISNLGGFKSIKDFIDAIEMVANSKKEFASFIKVANDMRTNEDLANKIYTDLNKFTIDKLEIAIDGYGSIKSIQSNNSNNPVRKLYFNLRNDLKGSSIQTDNIDIEGRIDELKTKFKGYKKSANMSRVKSARRANLQTNVAKANAATFDGIVRELKELYKTYFPSMNELDIDNYIERNSKNIASSRNDNVDRLISYLGTVNKAAKLSLAEKEDRDFKYREVQAENRARQKKYEAAIAANVPNAKYVEKKLPKFDGEYLRKADEVLGHIALAIEPYTYSKAELNSRNTNGNLNSDVIYNNFITNIAKICGDREALSAWVKEKLKSTEYDYSNILIDEPDKGIIGLFRKKVNKEYELTPYAEKIISPYLLNGVSNQQTGTNADYTTMSDGDYYLVGLYAYTKKLQTYKKYNTITANTQEVTTSPFLMRIPSDAPKNFAISMPRYSASGLWNYDSKAMTAYINFRKNEFIKVASLNTTDEQITKFNAMPLSVDEVINLVTNTPTEIKTSPGKLITLTPKLGECQKIAYAISKPNEGYQYHYFEGILVDKGKGNYALANPKYIGQAIFSDLLDDYRNGIEQYVTNEFKTLHPEAHQINTNHPLFNAYLNVLKGEIFDYYKAAEDVKHSTKDQLVEWFHYNPKVGVRDKNGNLTGNAFKFTKLDSSVGYNVEKAVADIISNASSTGEIQLTGYTESANASASISFSPAVEKQLQDIIANWLDAYRTYFINETHNKFGSFLEGISNEEIAEYGFNAYIHFVNFDDLFEGNSKYYKDPQTFLKRAKESQAGGTSYSIATYKATQNTDSSFTQSVNEIAGSELKVGNNTLTLPNGKPVTLRTGWNGITIKNSVRPSTNRNALYKQLIDAGVDRTKATEIAEGFGYVTPEDGENGATTTTINDAQSYITIYEAARRLKILGEYPKYAKLIGQLTDATTNVEQINPNELEAFIQVMKNFYFDHYFNNRFGRHLPRQIKNAEFVLVPKFLTGTSLGQLADFMIENDIDQVNTQETSKAANYDVLTYWDNDGIVTPENLATFKEKAIKVKQPFSYMYLYKQQDVPQHIQDAQNKAGIQVMKKILDNSQSAVSTDKNNFINAYAANIREDFNTLMNKYGIKFDKSYRIIGDNGKVDYSRIYKLAMIEAARLGLNSNTIDYLSIKNEAAGPIMPSYMNIVSSKIESIVQSQFNKFITRQKLPGWHAAQITSVGLDGLIEKSKKLKTGETIETDTGKRVELAYHANKGEIEILLPKWAKSMFNQYDEQGNLVKEINIEDVDPEVLLCIGYRIPTEGKQSMSVMKVVGFLPEWMGSTIVVPDEWITQTGSGFNVDSIYGISYETYLGRDGKVHKVPYYEGNTDEDAVSRYKAWQSAGYPQMTFEEFKQMSIEDQNTRRARNNRIVESMINIMNDKSSLEENLARSNFDDITSANKALNELDSDGGRKRNVYNLFDQIQFHRNAMGGAMLKAFSVSRDTGNSVFNVAKAELSIPIRIKYSDRVNLDIASQAFDVKDGIVYHDRIGNSKNNKNVVGDYITVASSHTTAHILDAIKEGAIKNENEYTFAAFKTLFDIGCDAYTAMLWLRQPGVSKVVEAYYESQSVFVRGNYNPIHTAIKRVAHDLGIKIRNEVVTDNNNITEVMNALQTQYSAQFVKMYPNSKIAFDNGSESDINMIDVLAMEERLYAQSSGVYDKVSMLMDLAAILNFNYINDYAKVISDHVKVLNPDKFGAKQTIYSTRKVIDNIGALIESNKAGMLTSNGKTLIEAIYPGITKATEDGGFMPSIYLSANNEDSAYKILDSFLRYSTVPSILVNQGLFETESYNFTNAIKSIQDYLSGAMNEKLYNDFKKYVLEFNYKKYSRVISSPVYLGRDGVIEIDNETIKRTLEEGRSPVEDEQRRIYGFGYDINYNMNIDNVANPTAEEVEAFRQLTPAQKVHFVQRHLSGSQRTIFNYINVNLFNGYEFGTRGISSQVIRFDDQQQDMESIYKLFDAAFNNSNPIIRLTALDMIKYAFVVEGYQFRRGNISKVIKNNALYTSIENGGTGIIDDIRFSVSNVSDKELAATNVYEDYIRSHSTIPQVPTYRIRYNNGKPNLVYLPNSQSMYYFNLSTAKDTQLAKELRFIKDITTNIGETKIAIGINYINIVKGKLSTLYKVASIGEDNDRRLYLIPLNKLEANEHGEFSANPLNNRFPSTSYYNAIIQESIDKKASFSRLIQQDNALFKKETIEEYRYKKPKVDKEIIVPTDTNFIATMSSQDAAIRNFIRNINERFSNPYTELYWAWNGSQVLKQAFGTLNVNSRQTIVDNNGVSRDYLIQRREVKLNKKISNAAQLDGIELAKRNGVKKTDTIYVIKEYKQVETVEQKKDIEDAECASAIDHFC